MKHRMAYANTWRRLEGPKGTWLGVRSILNDHILDRLHRHRRSVGKNATRGDLCLTGFEQDAIVEIVAKDH